MDDAPAHADVASTSTSAAAAAATATTSAPPPPPAASLPPAINALTPEDHVAFMCRAIALSRAAGLEQRTGGCFGAVVVDSVTKKVLGEGQNRVLETKDPTAHGEITGLRQARVAAPSPGSSPLLVRGALPDVPRGVPVGEVPLRLLRREIRGRHGAREV